MKNRFIFFLTLFFVLVWVTACNDDDDVPPAENEEEIITDVTLTFTPDGGGSAVTATAQDSDGEGPQGLEVQDNVVLAASTTYLLTMTLENSINGEDITEEIDAEDDEHLFFFGWTEGLFSNPAGNGNIDNRADAVRYLDEDENELPVGLETAWTTGTTSTGTFRILLKHQPNIKSEISTSQEGESDLDLTWDITIQ